MRVHINSFLWCMGLKTGSKLVGVIHLMVSICLMIYCAIFAEHARANIGTVEDDDSLYSTWYKVAIIMAVVSAVHVLLAATLLGAIYNKSIVCLRIWLLAMCALFLATLAYVLGTRIAYRFSDSGFSVFLQCLEGLPFFCLVVYCILCVYSYYLMLKCSLDMEGPNNDDC